MRVRRVALGAIAALGLPVLIWVGTGRPVRYGAVVLAGGEPDSSPSAAYRVERVTLRTDRERTLTCLLRLPNVVVTPGARPTATHAAAPALLVAGGRRTGRRAVLYLDTTFTGVALSCDYPWAELARLRGWRLIARLPRLRAEIVATPEAMVLAATYLQRRAGDRPLVALGASLGVPPVAAWAARDARPRAVALLYGGGELWRLFAANLEDDVKPAWLRPIVARTLGALLSPIEPVRTVGAIAPRPLLVIASDEDPWIPRESVEALYAAARDPKRLIWLTGVHMRTGDQALLKALADSTLAWVAEVVGEAHR
jgi:fermentation-respiration switch protein FrsA (DUF1100 family)